MEKIGVVFRGSAWVNDDIIKGTVLLLIMKQTINKNQNNPYTIYVIGALIGLSAFLGEQIVWRVVPLDVYLSLIYVGGLIAGYVTPLIALLPLAFVWRYVFRRLRVQRPGYSALAALWLTDVFVSLFIIFLRGGFAGWSARLLLYAAVGALTTPLVVRLYAKIKNDAYAGYVAIALLFILPVCVSFFTNYMTVNSRFLLGY